MPFDLAEAHATFQGHTQKVLNGLVPHKYLISLDDITAHGESSTGKWFQIWTGNQAVR